MGVPSYFKWISDRHKTLIRDDLPVCDKRILFLDFNGAIHPAVKADPQLLLDNMPAAVCMYLDNLINQCQPTEVYIAIDGVAPRAKMEQQRERRYKSAMESNYLRDLALRTGREALLRKEPVDFNMISPGTKFMDDLHEKLIVHIKEKYTKMIVTLNGANVAGEGEHKIMDEIRKRNDSEISGNQYIVYGLDADLIFLSMLNKPSIFLMREASQFERTETIGPNFRYFDVGGLTNIIMSFLDPNVLIEDLHKYGIANAVGGREVGPRPKMLHIKKRTLLDYTYLCFFLGNDFIPRLQCLRIRDGSIADLIVLYKETRWSLDDYLVNENLSINKTFLLRIITELDKMSDQLLLQQTSNRQDRIAKFNYYNASKDTYEREKELYQCVEARYPDTLQLGTAGWRNRYYRYYMNINNRNESEFMRHINPICKSYIEGTVWVLKYYVGHHNNWSWYYPYNAAPTTYDLMNWLTNTIGSYINYTFSTDMPVTPVVQLLSILPPDSANLLPDGLSRLMLDKESVVNYMYPLKFRLLTEGNIYLHECRPVLPHIDQELLGLVVGSSFR